MALGVSQNGLNAVLRHLELFRDFGYAYSIIIIIDNRMTGILVPRSTGAPLCTRGLTSTKGHSDHSIFSSVAMADLQKP